MGRIPAGHNRIFAVLGWDNTGGRIVYKGQTASGIDISPGEIADAGTVDAYLLCPPGLRPPRSPAAGLTLTGMIPKKD